MGAGYQGEKEEQLGAAMARLLVSQQGKESDMSIKDFREQIYPPQIHGSASGLWGYQGGAGNPCSSKARGVVLIQSSEGRS